MSQSISLQVGPVALTFITNNEEYAQFIKKEWGSFKAITQPLGIITLTTKLTNHSQVIVKNGKEVEYLFTDNVGFKNDLITTATPALIGEYNTKTNLGEALLNITSNEDLLPLRNFVRLVWGILLLKENCLLMHASGIKNNNKGYLFTGKPGQGKTTIAKKSLHLDVYGDECVGVHIKDDQAWLIPTFFGGELSNTQKDPVSINTTCIIEKNKPLSIQPLTNIKGFYALLQNNLIYMVYDKRSPEVFKKIISVTKQANQYINVCSLTSQLNDNIWTVLK